MAGNRVAAINPPTDDPDAKRGKTIADAVSETPIEEPFPFWALPLYLHNLRPEPPFARVSAEIAKEVSKRRVLGAEKSPKMAEKSKIPKKVGKSVCFDFLGHSLALFSRRPKTLFLRLFFSMLGQEGPETPVDGGSGRKL